MKRKVPPETILLMGVKVLNVAKSIIREKNARLSVWQQNSVVESSLGKLNFFWQRNFLPHPLNSRNPLANELKLDLSLDSKENS